MASNADPAACLEQGLEYNYSPCFQMVRAVTREAFRRRGRIGECVPGALPGPVASQAADTPVVRGWLLAFQFVRSNVALLESKIRPAPMRSTNPRDLTLNKPVYDGKQKCRGKTTHQHTRNTFYWPQALPCLRQNYASIADRRIAGCREVERRPPRWKTPPAIESRPHQDL